ncbi:hypothetical protein Syun_003091 [Stephania yunnanensis]|uniref:Uncharacterized protein n=1 Tax=Stephania yunnanensis TaxID=152371 RepID=A0AAP0Q1A9_9MAGN
MKKFDSPQLIWTEAMLLLSFYVVKDLNCSNLIFARNQESMANTECGTMVSRK